MKRSGVLLIGVCLAFAASGPVTGVRAQDTRNAQSIAQSLGDRIATTSVHTDATNVEWGRAVGVVDAPFATVMNTVTDYGDYQAFLPHFRQSRVLSRRGENALVYLEVSLLRNTATLWGQLHIYARRTQGTTHIIEGRLLQGNVNHFLARWEVTPLGDGHKTLVAFQLLVDPRLPLPSSFVTHHNVDAAKKTLIALRKRLQRGSRLADNR